jgi:hypothetical protein
MRLEWILETADEAGSPSTAVLRQRGVYAVEGPPRVLLVRDPAEGPSALPEVWRERDFAVEEKSPSTLRGRAGDWAADLLVLEGGVVELLTPGQWAEIRRWVWEDGGGLLLLGGPGAWLREGSLREDGAGLSPLLPLPLEEREKGARAVLVVLDRSGSMNLPVGGVTKMSLANEGAARVLQALEADDFFGVLAVDVAVDVVLPLEVGHDRGSAAETVRNTGVGGGGIYAYPALLESWRRLRTVPARGKHLILFADADDVEEKFEGQTTGRTSGPDSLDLATTMRGAGITISVVALGEETDKDVSWLRELARRGDGRFSLTNNAAELPRLFLETAEEMLPDRRAEEPFFAAPTPPGRAVFSGIEWDRAPPLLGANEVEAQPGASVWLRGREDAPLLAQWNVGAGQVAAFASAAAGNWSIEWLRWPQYSAFWQALALALTAPNLRETWMLSTRSVSGGSLRLTARRVTDSPDVPLTFPPWEVRTEAGESIEIPWRLTAPGVFEAELARPESALLFHPTTTHGERTARPHAWNPGPPPRVEPAAEALRDLALRAGGRFLHSPEDAWNFEPRPWSTTVPLRPWLLVAAALLLPAYWLARRGREGRFATEPPPTSG